jgi:tetratricopeptide (TPR) repeat protein
MLQQAGASGDADAMLSAGAGALQAGLYAEALGPVVGALRKHPGHAQLWHLLGLLHRSLDDPGPSVDAFNKAAQLAPDDAMIAHGRACICYEAGLPAVRLFERARALAPSDLSILRRHAAALIAEGQGDAATDLLDSELSRNPGWLDGHTALARVRWTRGECDQFTDSFERALRAGAGTLALWRAYIEMLLYDRLHGRALEIIQRARAAVGPHVTFDAAEAIARSELGELDAAGALFGRLAHLRDVAVIVHHLRFLIRAGRIEEAAKIAEREAPRDPTHQIWPYLSLAWRALGDARWEWLDGDPRFIGVYDLAERLAPLDALAERLRALHRTKNQPLDQSLRGGTQTEGNLFSRIEPEIRMLRQAVVEAVERHVAQLPAPPRGHPMPEQRRQPVRFSGSWSVRLSGGGRHVNHFHTSGYLSSALYIALPDEDQRGPGEAGWLVLGEASELGVDLPPVRTVEPRPGRLVLFPSTMWHGTRPFAAGERLTVAFDVKRPD